jgi:spore maturation protein CgeB
MIAAGWSPSVRLFEAAACGTPIISDRWNGIETLFAPQREILLASTTAEVVRILRAKGEDERRDMGERARARVLAEHTSAHRAEQLEAYAFESLARVAA